MLCSSTGTDLEQLVVDSVATLIDDTEVTIASRIPVGFPHDSDADLVDESIDEEIVLQFWDADGHALPELGNFHLTTQIMMQQVSDDVESVAFAGSSPPPHDDQLSTRLVSFPRWTATTLATQSAPSYRLYSWRLLACRAQAHHQQHQQQGSLRGLVTALL